MNLDRNELFRLFGALSDETIGDADHERLQKILREDREARRLWFLFNDVESGLAGRAAVEFPAIVSSNKVVQMPRRFAWWVGAVAAVIVAVLWLAPRSTSVPVATLSASSNARWSDPNVELMLRGGELPRGLIRLDAGAAEFLFAGGATALIEGPAAFEMAAANRLILKSGRVIGRCGKGAAKLIVVTPNATVEDLGTEFGVSVGDNQEMRVAVIKGAVELVAGRHPQRLTAGQAACVNKQGALEKADFSIADFSKLATILPDSELPLIGGSNRLRDPQMKNYSQEWQFTEGYVDSAASGVPRVHANGSTLWPLLWQTVPTGDIAGRTVIASVSAMQPGDDPLRVRQNAIVKIVFVDASGREFAQAERHFLRAGSPGDKWIRSQIAARAPSGTSSVRFQALLNARGLQTGSVVFEDASLFIGDAEP